MREISKEPILIGNPMERRRAEDDIGNLIEVKSKQVATDELDPVTEVGPEVGASLFNHLRRDIDADDLAARQAFEQQPC